MTRPAQHAVAAQPVATPWTLASIPGPHNWKGVAQSTDGSVIVAADNGGGIWISKDFGVTWSQTGSGARAWVDVAISSDGSHIIAGFAGSGPPGSAGIAVSSNEGTAWASPTLPYNPTSGLTGGVSVAISGSGSTMAVADTAFAEMFMSSGGAFSTVTSPGLVKKLALSRDGGTILATWSGGATPGVLVSYTPGYAGEGTFLGLVSEAAPATAPHAPGSVSWSTQRIADGYTYTISGGAGTASGYAANGVQFADPDNFTVHLKGYGPNVDASLNFYFDGQDQIRPGTVSFAGGDGRGVTIWTDPADGGLIILNSFQLGKLFGSATTPAWEVDAVSSFTGYSVNVSAKTVTLSDVNTNPTSPSAKAVVVDMTTGATLSTTSILPDVSTFDNFSVNGSMDGAVYGISSIPDYSDPGNITHWPRSWNVYRWEQSGAQAWHQVITMPPQRGVQYNYSAKSLGGPVISEWNVTFLVAGDLYLTGDADAYPPRFDVDIYVLDQKTGAAGLSQVIGPTQFQISESTDAVARLSLFNWYPGFS